MRSEQTMFELILNVANRDHRIRAAYLNGSRTNPHVPKDMFQDYDLVYMVRETASFIQTPDWIDLFGERLYMQRPEALDASIGKPCDLDHCYGYLIQLADGNRIDLHLKTPGLCIQEVSEEKLTVVLLDKDNLLPRIPPPSDEDYWVKRPTQAEYHLCCNEFWWLFNNVAKGLWRQEIPYAMDMLNLYIRPQLILMLSWFVGIRTDFSCSVGKSGKYLNRHLPEDTWNRFLSTYPAGRVPDIWEASFPMCRLFQETALLVGSELGFPYDSQEAANSIFFLEHIHCLPPNAKEIF